MHNSKPYLIGVSGGSGSGKTTFVKLLKKQFSDSEICVFSMDDYYKPREEQIFDENEIKNFDLPTSINRELYHQDLLRLLNGEKVSKEAYTFNNVLKENNVITFHPCPIIIVEGLFAFYFKEIFKLLNLKIYVDSIDTLKVIRRIKRDQVERNYPLDDVLYRYENHVAPTYKKYILPFKSEVDIIINNNNNFSSALNLVTDALKYKLSH